MSILDLPRLHFGGQITVNPDTANNNDVLELIDPVRMALRNPVNVMSDADAMAFLQSAEIARGNAPEGEQLGPQTVFLKSGWNLYGDHTIVLSNCNVTGSVDTSGKFTPAAGSPLAGLQVSFLPSADDSRGAPVLVDVDCSGLVTTQFWFGGMAISDAQGNPVLTAQANARGFQRRLSFQRTIAPIVGEQNFMNFGCIVQFALPRDALVFSDISQPGVASLAAALWPGQPNALTIAQAPAQHPSKIATPGPQGVHIRFTMLQAEPDLSGLELAKEFALGNGTPNPAHAYLVGTIGIWQQGELESEVPGRFLKPGGDKLSPGSFVVPHVAWRGRAQDANYPQLQDFVAPGHLPGNAVVSVRPQPDGSAIIGLDLCNFVNLDGYRNNPSRPSPQGFDFPLMHADLGQLELAVVTGTSVTPLGTVPYGGGDVTATAHALAQGLVFDLPITAAQAGLVAAGKLVLRVWPPVSVSSAVASPPAPVPLISETTLRIETDVRGRYTMVGDTTPLRIQVTAGGVPYPQPVAIYLTMFQNVIAHRGDNLRPDQTIGQNKDASTWRWVPIFGSGDAGQPVPIAGVSQDGNVIVTGTPNAQGFLDIPMRAADYGAGMIAFSTDQTFSATPFLAPINPAWGSAYYACFHVFFDEDVSQYYAPDGSLQWSDVYEVALRYFAVLFPAMSTHIALSDEGTMSLPNVARMLLARTDISAFKGTHYMPLTRAWPISHRQMLRDWACQVLNVPREPALSPQMWA